MNAKPQHVGEPEELYIKTTDSYGFPSFYSRGC